MRFKHQTLAIISGALWLTMGSFLLYKGVGKLFKVLANYEAEGNRMTHYLGESLGHPANGVIVVLTMGLMIGYLKGKFALSRSLKRTLKRITTLPNPAPITSLYGWGYLALIVGMMGLGMGLRALGVPDDVRGMILVAVGVGLIRSSVIAFRYSFTYGNETASESQ